MFDFSGAKQSLREWRLQKRPDHRLLEIKDMFEYNSANPSKTGDLKISSPSHIEEIIDRQSIKAYFDMICRDGLITAEIGEYLHLSKQNIFGGNEYNTHNERMTFVNVNLSQSTIDLGNSLFHLFKVHQI
jgi:hypothetical protein